MKFLKEEFKDFEPYSSPLITDGIILNANESGYLPPKKVLDKIYKSLVNIEFNRYPDMDERLLNKAIAKHYEIEEENVTCGVGSDELLDTTFRAVLSPNDLVLGFMPSFSMYKVFTKLSLSKFIQVEPDSNMLFDVDKMIDKMKTYQPKIAIICSPNNPTGQYFSKDDVRKIIEASKNTLILLDLAYIDFAKEDYTKLALEYDNVIAFRTFSKALALPSIRVGYAISKKDNIDLINSVKAPYSINSISQIIAKIAIDNYDEYKAQIELIKEQREFLFKELIRLNLKAYKSEANFIYVLMDDSYNEKLLENKIYIRKFASGIYRITVGTEEENKKLLEVLRCVQVK